MSDVKLPIRSARSRSRSPNESVPENLAPAE